MQIRKINPDYLDFLRSVDPHVPVKDDRPWLWPVRINGIDYGIPLTTSDLTAGHAGYLRCRDIPEHGINLRYMVPVPVSALEPPMSLTPELRVELIYYEEMRKYIEAEAQILYRLSGFQQMDRVWQQYSCDYKKLESIYSQWQPGLKAGHFLYPKEDPSMPISKEGKLYYTEAQYKAAKYNSNALEYARSQGYELIRESSWYKLKEHDSMVFTPQGTWFWNSRGVHGTAIEFQIYYENKTLVEAVLTLAGENELVNAQGRSRPVVPAQTAPRPDLPETPAIPFRQPKPAMNFRRMWYYLCAERGLDKDVVKELIHQKLLYQSDYTPAGGKPRSNVVFVYKDPEGNPVGAFQRGTQDREGQAPYKRDVPGSVKRWGWLMKSPELPARSVAVFEGAIDAASDASLAAMDKGDAWRQDPVDRLSLEGLSFQPLQNYLQANPAVSHVVLMLDADSAGRRTAQEFSRKLSDLGYHVEDRVPPFGKDWNEVLNDTRSMAIEQRPDSPELVPEE